MDVIEVSLEIVLILERVMANPNLRTTWLPDVCPDTVLALLPWPALAFRIVE